MPFKRKSASVHWEFMFTRPVFGTADIAEQHRLLTEVSRLVDSGRIRTTLNETFGTITAANLKKAHAQLESGTTRGKIVLEGSEAGPSPPSSSGLTRGRLASLGARGVNERPARKRRLATAHQMRGRYVR